MEKYPPEFFLSEVRTSQSQLGLIFGIYFLIKKVRGRLNRTPVKLGTALSITAGVGEVVAAVAGRNKAGHDGSN